MYRVLINLFAGVNRPTLRELVPMRAMVEAPVPEDAENPIREFDSIDAARVAGEAWAGEPGRLFSDFEVEWYPEIGDGATWLIWTDCVACTVVAVSGTGHKVTVQRDRATRTDDRGAFDERQEHTFEPDPGGEMLRFSRRTLSDGRSIFKMVGTRTGEQGNTLGHGRREYRDPCF